MGHHTYSYQTVITIYIASDWRDADTRWGGQTPTILTINTKQRGRTRAER
jgi:hypothetical protein